MFSIGTGSTCAFDGHADAYDGVRAQARLVRCPVQIDHGLVDQPLVVYLVAEQFWLDFVNDALDRAADSLTAVLGATVPQLDGLEGAGGGSARHSGPPDGPVVQRDLDLEGRIAAGVQSLPGMDRFNGGHRRLLASVCVSSALSGCPYFELTRNRPVELAYQSSLTEPWYSTGGPRRVNAETPRQRRGRFRMAADANPRIQVQPECFLKVYQDQQPRIMYRHGGCLGPAFTSLLEH
jgi:hypothetical protein